jgi:hypothetical protein
MCEVICKYHTILYKGIEYLTLQILELIPTVTRGGQ